MYRDSLIRENRRQTYARTQARQLLPTPHTRAALTHLLQQRSAEEGESRSVGQEDHPKVRVDGDRHGVAAQRRANCTISEGRQETGNIS